MESVVELAGSDANGQKGGEGLDGSRVFTMIRGM
jgi:hypothetical protein